MTVELAVRLEQDVSFADFVRSVDELLKTRFPSSPQPSWPPLTSTSFMGSNAAFMVGLGSRARVEMSCTTVGPVEIYGHETGWWVHVPMSRSVESFLLGAIAAATLGSLSGAAVVDEWLYFKEGRFVAPTRIVDLIAKTEGSTFEVVAQEFCDRLGIHFGEGR